MRERKKLLEDYADAFIITPGGMGTFDEIFEILCLKQLGRTNKPIVFYNINNYYKPLFDLIENAIKGNFMNENNRMLYYVANTIDEVFNYIDDYEHEIKDVSHYKSVGKRKIKK